LKEVYIAAALAACLLHGQTPDSGTRAIVAEEFLKERPAKAAAKAPPRTSRRPQLGMTLWRLRTAKPADTGVRILVHDGVDEVAWIPERVTSNTPLRDGDRIRLAFESATNGYLYIIDAEQYADGTSGEPYLVFPTTRTRNGDNRVFPGRLVEIPSQEDRPNYLTLRHSRADQTGELLSVIVAPQPLEITIGSKALKLGRAQVEEWRRKWEQKAVTVELASGAGLTWTKAEQEAGASATRVLTQDEPSPQTVYRVSAAPAGQPFLLDIQLKYEARKIGR